MFDLTGSGSLDKKIYYGVATNKIINTYKAAISSMYFWKHKNDAAYTMERIFF